MDPLTLGILALVGLGVTYYGSVAVENQQRIKAYEAETQRKLLLADAERRAGKPSGDPIEEP